MSYVSRGIVVSKIVVRTCVEAPIGDMCGSGWPPTADGNLCTFVDQMVNIIVTLHQ